MKIMKIFIFLVVITIFQGCSLYQAQYKALPFSGFTKYPKPNKVQIQVRVNCYQEIQLDNKKDSLGLGECITKEDTIKLLAKIKILEKIVSNYEKDIEAYNNIYKGLK